MEKMERVKTRSRTVQGTNVGTSLDEVHAPTNEHIPTFQLDVGRRLCNNMNKISESIKAIRERLISLERNLEQLMQQVTHLEDSVRALHTVSEKLECLTSHTEQLTTLSAISEELQSITQLTQEVNNIREGLTALDNVVYKDD